MLCWWKWNLLTKENQARCFHQQKHLHVPVSKTLRDPGIEKGKKPELEAFEVQWRGGSRVMLEGNLDTGGKLAWWGRNEISSCSPLCHLCSLEGAWLPPQVNCPKPAKPQNSCHGCSFHQVNPWVKDGEESSFRGCFLNGWSHRLSEEGACSSSYFSTSQFTHGFFRRTVLSLPSGISNRETK